MFPVLVDKATRIKRIHMLDSTLPLRTATAGATTTAAYF